MATAPPKNPLPLTNTTSTVVATAGDLAVEKNIVNASSKVLNVPNYANVKIAKTGNVRATTTKVSLIKTKILKKLQTRRVFARPSASDT